MARPRSDGSPSTAPNRQRLSHFAVKNPSRKTDPLLFGILFSAGWRSPCSHPAPWHGKQYMLSTVARVKYILPNVNAVGLADARKLAARIMLQVAEGKDPAAERRAERSVDTFEDLAGRYLKYSERKNKSWRQAAALVRRHLLPKWLKLRATDISRSDVNAMVASIAAPITANQVLASASAIFTWAVKESGRN